MSVNRIRIFISHSSVDIEFAKALTALLRASLPLSAGEIRCTSIDGHRLPAGAVTDDQLRSEIHTADTFIGIVSADSLKSLYVVFELGARWGGNLHLIPLLAPGADPDILGGPLKGLNALSSSSRAQLHQLIDDLGKRLNISPESPAVYAEQVDSLLAVKGVEPIQFVTKIVRTDPGAIAPDTVSESELKIMFFISKAGDFEANAYAVAMKIKESDTRTKYYIDKLFTRKFISTSFATGFETYGLTREGRTYLVEGGHV